MKTSIATAAIFMVIASNGYAERHTTPAARISDLSSQGLAATGGYRFFKYFALESRTSNLGQYKPGASGGLVKTDFSALTGNAVGILPFGKSGFELYGQFGAGMVSRNTDSAFPVPEDNENGTVGTAGMGLRFTSNNLNALTITAGYDTYLFHAADSYSGRNYDQSVTMTKLGLQFSF